MAEALARLLAGADTVAAAAADLLLRMQGRPLQIARKERRDVVTAADLAAERVILDGLRRLTPQAAILSEEAGASGPETGARWVVDPLDGTVNYASGLPWFSVSLAYQEQGRTRLGVVRAPAAGLVAHYAEDGTATIDGVAAAVSATEALADAVVSVVVTSHFSPAEVARSVTLIGRLADRCRGVRVVVSGALELALVACGRLDGFVSLKADQVSHAAAMPLLRAAGGRVTTASGRDAADADLDKIASNGRLHEALLALIPAATPC